MSSTNTNANTEQLSSEIIEARKKFSEKFGNIKLGGKGTQKKKKISTAKVGAVQDKKIASLAKKSRISFYFNIRG